MKTLKVFIACCTTLLLTGCAGLPTGAHNPEKQAYRAAVSAAEAERRILVTFTDRSIGRVALADPAFGYRSRGATTYRTSTYSRDIAASLGRDYGLTMIADWPVTAIGVHCVVFEIDRNRSVAEVITSLGNDTRVGGVQRMQQFRVLSDPYSQFQPALESMQILDAHRWSTGTGVTIAVIDTGVDVGHPDLNGQVIANEDMVGATGATSGQDIHGTAVAGLIAALENNNEGIVGVAPGAKLITYRACWQESANNPAAICDSFTLAKALNNAIDKKPKIINLSLTGPEDPLLSVLIKKALDEQISIVAAAPEQKEDTTSGFPASVPGVIAVHALRDDGPTGQVAVTKDNGFFAPGMKVFTTFPQHAYNFISGNSFAAAHVSGVVALMLALKPELTRVEIEQALKHDSNDVHANVTTCINACTVVLRLHPGGDCHRKQLTHT